jgi:hypothetical protein
MHVRENIRPAMLSVVNVNIFCCCRAYISGVHFTICHASQSLRESQSLTAIDSNNFMQAISHLVYHIFHFKRRKMVMRLPDMYARQ